jgi:hypothetical protein
MFRLLVRVSEPERSELINAAIPCYRKRGQEHWYLKTDEVYTPRGLPLRFYVDMGMKGDKIAIESATAILFSTSMSPPPGGELMLLLPTDEALYVSILSTWQE